MCPSSRRSPAMPLIPLPATPIRLIFLGGSSRIAKALVSLSRFMRLSRPFFSSSYTSSSSRMRFAPVPPDYREPAQHSKRPQTTIPNRLTLEDEDDDEGRV